VRPPLFTRRGAAGGRRRAGRPGDEAGVRRRRPPRSLHHERGCRRAGFRAAERGRRLPRPGGRARACAVLLRGMRRALVVERPGAMALFEREELRPGPGEVLVRPAFCGLCGTDLEILRGDLDPAYVTYPVTLGHEWAGVVEAVGDGVDAIRPGLRCVAEGIIPCGLCAACRSGAT